MRSLRVLIGYESSGITRTAFRRLGHDAVSCDLLATELPGPHYQGNVWDIIRDRWDLGIFHPTCTFMCNSSSKHLYIGKKKSGGIDPQRWRDMEKSAEEFRELDCDLDYPRAIENPIMLPYPKEIIGRGQDQIVQPYNFGHREMKATCYWLRGLKPLVHTTPDLRPPDDPEERKEWQKVHRATPSANRWRDRSRTYEGIAEAMARQWGGWATGLNAALIRAEQAITEVTSEIQR